MLPANAVGDDREDEVGSGVVRLGAAGAEWGTRAGGDWAVAGVLGGGGDDGPPPRAGATPRGGEDRWWAFCEGGVGRGAVVVVGGWLPYCCCCLGGFLCWCGL